MHLIGVQLSFMFALVSAVCAANKRSLLQKYPQKDSHSQRVFIYDDEAFLHSECRKDLELEKGPRGERWYGQYLQGVALEEEIRNSHYFTVDPSEATLSLFP